jgi:hypothetical protein
MTFNFKKVLGYVIVLSITSVIPFLQKQLELHVQYTVHCTVYILCYK